MSWAQSFYWSARRRLTPWLENSQYAYVERLRGALRGPRRWLDLGCGHALFQDWLAKRTEPLDLEPHFVVGLDPDHSALVRHDGFEHRVQGDGETLPFRSGAFDLVTANMVLEHVAEPSAVFNEVARVLAPGGTFLTHTPNARGYTTALTRLIPPGLRSRVAGALHGRDHADVYPTFYRANSVSTLTRLGSESKLSVAHIEFVQTSPQLIAIPPLMLAELLAIRALSRPSLAPLRACLIVEFRKSSR